MASDSTMKNRHEKYVDVKNSDSAANPTPAFFRFGRPYHRVSVSFKDSPSLTRQSETAACDINHIISKFERTGLIDHVNTRSAMYFDVSQVVDYQSALNAVMSAEKSFSDLPSKIRFRFSNDPAQLIAFLLNPDNRQEAIQLGLIDDAILNKIDEKNSPAPSAPSPAQLPT